MIKVGDVVSLKTGGLRMTVEFLSEFEGYEGRVFCLRFDDKNNLHKAEFRLSLLQKI